MSKVCISASIATMAAYPGSVLFARHVSIARLCELHAAAIAHDLGPRQERLLEGLDRAFIATIPSDGYAAERLLTTLHRLNAVEKLADGSVPLHVWLMNALALTKDDAFKVGRPERAVGTMGVDVPAPDDPKVQAIRAKYKEREALAEQGQSVAGVVAEIVRLKRELYAGSELGPKALLSESQYELIEVLGKGGVGTVWKAYDDRRKRHVAIKVLLPEHGQAVLSRFRRGARCMSELDHPNIVRVVQSEGVDDRDGIQRWFFVMEYLSGGTLKKAVLDKRINPEEALRRVLEVGSGLVHAHAKGMIHRDVSPENIVLAADATAKLTDFDLVRAEDTTGLTKTGQAFGKMMYLAPELWHGAKDADVRADVYALGMTAMFAIHGAELPPSAMFSRESFIEMLAVEESVRAVVRRAVALGHQDRYANVDDLCRELALALALDKKPAMVSPTVVSPVAPKAPAVRGEDRVKKLLDPATPEEERLRIGEALGREGDPRLGEDQRWIDVPEGPFWRGAAEGDGQAYDWEKPASLVVVSAFKVARWLVTVQEYKRFITDGEGYRKRDWWSGEGWAWREHEKIDAPVNWSDQLQRPSNVPVTRVSWWEAEAYCAWQTSISRNFPKNWGIVRRAWRTPRARDLPKGWVIRLPTEAEWEKAARGPESERRVYPWGDAWDAAKANVERRIGKPTPVGCFPGDRGPYGAWDQAGNVWEWCLDWFATKAYERPGKKNPRLLKAVDAPLVQAYDPTQSKWVGARCRCVRGGGWNDAALLARVSYRGWLGPWDRVDGLGFRCVMACRPEDL